MDEVEKKEGFVALIDVLGFRELVNREDGLEQVKVYIDAVISILNNGNHPSPLQFVLFSDNLVINTTDASNRSLDSIIRACSILSYDLSLKGIAVRGAIAHGSFMRSPTTRQGVILAGRPIVEANNYQHQQNWIGTILAPSVVRHFESSIISARYRLTKISQGENEHEWAEKNAIALRLHRFTRIPFHTISPVDKGNFDGFVIVPLPAEIRTVGMYTTALREYGFQLGKMKMAAPDPISQEKYSKTLDWCCFPN